jgi:hypothetical protein
VIVFVEALGPAPRDPIEVLWRASEGHLGAFGGHLAPGGCAIGPPEVTSPFEVDRRPPEVLSRWIEVLLGPGGVIWGPLEVIWGRAGPKRSFQGPFVGSLRVIGARA